MTDLLPPATCGATKTDGTPCAAPPKANGRCRIHGGNMVGKTTIRQGLYRSRLSDEEQELYDQLLVDTEFDDLKKEIAMMRIMIDRSFSAIIEGNESRVPMQTLPGYVEKLIKLIERMRPLATRVVLEDNLETELQEMMNEERAGRYIANAQKREKS